MIVAKKCTECHHEWQGTKDKKQKCGWCGAPGYNLEEKNEMGRLGDLLSRLLEGNGPKRP